MSAGLSKKLQRLDDLLLGGAVGDDAMLLSELDGFLTGLIVGPDMIMPSEWLPVVWGGEAPVFESERQAQAVIGLIMERYNGIVRELDRNRYSPIYDIDNDDSVMWETWIEGFWQAVVLRPDGWLDIGTNDDEDDDDVQAALFSLSRLHEIAATPSADLEPLEVDEELENLAPDMIVHAVGILHRARHRQTAQGAASANQNRPKVGRNQPCPCGSGKKFKNCCLKK